jgi:hypothetical protein
MELLSHEFEQLALGEEAELDNGAIEAKAFGVLERDGFVNLLWRQQAFVLQQLRYTHIYSAPPAPILRHSSASPVIYFLSPL